MSRIVPEAVFDVLYITRFSSPKGYAVTLSEVTYFAYLGCLLSIYDGQPASRWGYMFAATKSISPFSESLDSAVEVLAATSRVEGSAQGLRAMERGNQDLERYQVQHLFADRTRYLRAACNSSLAIPLPAVGAALSNEPGLRSALQISASRELLTDEAGPRALHRHFERLAEELPDRSDLFLAAVTWIGSLADSETSLSGDASPDIDEGLTSSSGAGESSAG